MRRLLVTLAVLVLAVPAAGSAGGRERLRDKHAGTWQTYVISSGAGVPVPAPAKKHAATTRAELAELRAAQAARLASPDIQASIAKWDAQPAFQPWTEKALALIAANATSTPRGQRVLALLHIAMYDTTVAAWHWKFRYERRSPAALDDSIVPAVSTPRGLPTYPSEHAALAGAAATVLQALYPADTTIATDEQAAAASRVYAGTNYPSDVTAGLALGTAVAQQVLAAAAGDNLSGAEPAGRLPVAHCSPPAGGCLGFWEPVPPRALTGAPTDPFAGTWHTWVISSEAAFLPPSPPWFVAGSPPTVDQPVLTAAAMADYDASNVTKSATPQGALQKLIVDTWAGIPGKHWNEIALALEHDAGLSLPRAIRASALIDAAGADAIQANWYAKTTYWEPRPQQVINRYVDAAWTPYRATPNDPAYSSGLATVSGAISDILVSLFPSSADVLRADAVDAANSRLYDGTHYPHDIAAGLAAGRAIATVYLDRAHERGDDDDGEDGER